MAKKKVKSKKQRKSAPAKRRGGDSAGAVSGDSTEGSRSLPTPRVSEAQINILVALIQGVDQRLQNIERRQEAEHERQERGQGAAPTPPPPNNAAFSRQEEFMEEMRERLARIEARQQPSRDPHLDVPASVGALRRFFSGACNSLGIHRPTPAIIGRAMHDEKAFDSRTAKSPYMLFESIYHTVRRIILPQALQRESAVEATLDYVHLDDKMVELIEDRSSRPKNKHATYYDSQLKKRLRLLKDMRLACIEENKTGQRSDYSRYLTPEGRDLFNGWPEWTDATGGIGLVDEQAELRQNQHERAGPDAASTPAAT